jgi:uncharacterized membrane protein
VTFAYPLPWWGLSLAVALAALVAWQAYRRFAANRRRRAALSTLRFLTLLLLIFFLMRPVARSADDNARDAIVPILVDSSRSMSIDDAGGERRIDRARSLLSRELLPALGDRFDVEVLGFGDAVSPTGAGELSATARRSDLAGALADVRERYRGRVVAGIVLLSDGGDTSGSAESAIAAAEGRDGSPAIYPLGIGSETVGRDREVLSVTAAEAVLDDSRVDLAVSAVSHGHGSDPIELRLLENGRPLEVRRATPVAEGVPVREVFHVSPGPGAPTVYTVEIPSAAGELVPENNTRSTLVQPPARPRRVLLVEGAPGFEHSFMKRALAVDRGLEVDSVVRKGKNEEGSDTFYIQASRSRSDALASGYPARTEDLFAYDALVFANVEAGQLTRAQLEATRAFVSERGGGLLVLGARSFMKQGLLRTALEEVLPLDLSGRGNAVLPASVTPRGMNRVAITEVGAGHPIMQLSAGAAETRTRWEGVPALASTATLGGPRPGATVLAVTAGPGGAPRALVAVQRYGEGRSMIFTGEGSWRWRMMLPSADRSYDTFWRQAIRWLSLPATDPVTAHVPAGGSPGDTLPLSILVRDGAFEPQRDAAVNLQVAGPDGRIEQLRAAPGGTAADEAAGRFVARFRPDQPGVYRVTAQAARGSAPLGTTSTAMLVGGADLEMTDPRLNLALLRRLALASGGRLIDADDPAPLVAALRAGVPAATLAVQRDLWHNAWSFAAIVLLLGAEWGLRRRWGLR